ncbi:hypothetical protein LA080_007204 [Diaporthe eres]|nr:hypothetical protein LA080_007204 [Diaporthe eres]
MFEGAVQHQHDKLDSSIPQSRFHGPEDMQLQRQGESQDAVELKSNVLEVMQAPRQEISEMERAVVVGKIESAMPEMSWSEIHGRPDPQVGDFGLTEEGASAPWNCESDLGQDVAASRAGTLALSIMSVNMASESRIDFQGDLKRQADLEFQDNSGPHLRSESPWSLESLSSTEDMRPGSPASSHTFFEDIQDSLVAYDTRRPNSSPKPLWRIVEATCLNEFVSLPTTVPCIHLEGIGTVSIPTADAARTHAVDLDSETVRPYIPDEWWLPSTWHMQCATHMWKYSTDEYIETTVNIGGFVSLEEIDNYIDAEPENVVIPPWFTIWRKFATVQIIFLSEGQGKCSEPQDTEVAYGDNLRAAGHYERVLYIFSQS